MTARPLTFAFAAMSDLAVRPPHAIPIDEQLIEADDELTHRLATYPEQVRQRRMADDAGRRHVAIWRRILAELQLAVDLDRADAWTPPLYAAATRLIAHHDFSWADKVREIRRELQIRRNATADAIAKRRLSPDAACLRLERLDALHWRYWFTLAPIDYCPDVATADPAATRVLLRGLSAQRDAWLLEAAAAGDRAASAWLATWTEEQRQLLIGPRTTALRHLDIAALAGVRPDLVFTPERNAA